MNEKLLLAAVYYLYEWCGKKFQEQRGINPDAGQSYEQGKVIGRMHVYSFVRLEMRTLFAGLINFDE